MKTCNRFAATALQNDGEGPCCAVVVIQPGNDPGGWTIDLEARFRDAERTTAHVSHIVISAPAGKDLTRVAQVVSIPGAIGYSAIVTPPAGPAPSKGIIVALFCDLTPTPIGPINVDP